MTLSLVGTVVELRAYTIKASRNIFHEKKKNKLHLGLQKNVEGGGIIFSSRFGYATRLKIETMSHILQESQKCNG